MLLLYNKFFKRAKGNFRALTVFSLRRFYSANARSLCGIVYAQAPTSTVCEASQPPFTCFDVSTRLNDTELF